MCTSEEIARSMELGVAVDTGWYTTAKYDVTSSNQVDSDCYGWGSNGATSFGSYWSSTSNPPYASNDNCNAFLPILCCD